MARTIRIGGQDFERIRVNNNFYIDKTDFIKKVVGGGGRCNLDHAPETVWQDAEYEYAGAVFFREVCRTWRAV